MKNDYYHGSSSASLVGVLSRDSPGLKPLGMLLEAGQVPYVGEFYGSDVKKCISAVPEATIDGAITYALRYGKKSWTPEKGRETIEYEKKLLGEIKSSSWPNRNFMTKWNEGIIQAEMLRIENWKHLTAQEKELIMNPFSVIYGIQHRGEYFPIESAYLFEIGIPIVVNPEKLTIYVPTAQVSKVQNLAAGLPTKPEVQSFRQLRTLDIIDYYGAKKSIEWLLEQTLELDFFHPCGLQTS